MFASIYSPSFSNSIISHSFSFSEIISPDITKRIQEYATPIFNQLSDFFTSFDVYPAEKNIKTFALVSCLSLIALLVISMFRKNGSSIVPPPTPFK